MSKKSENKLTGFTISQKTTSDKVTQVTNFLNENYTIKVNCFDNSKSFIYSKVKKYNFPITTKTIWLHLMSEGISCSETLLRAILSEPNYIDSYNPIEDYFDALKGKFKGKSHIDLLCRYITARDFGDKPAGYYQERLNYILRKWLVASIACFKGLHENDVALGFINAKEGIGKTQLINFLMPADISDFSFLITDKNSNNLNLNDIFAKYFLVVFDELNGINKNYPEIFKSLLSCTTITYIPPYEKTYFKVKRLGNGAFTSNRTAELGGFLTQNMGLRRFASIEVDKIDWHAYSKEIDKDQIWAEALMLLGQKDYEYIWNDNDRDEFIQYNTRYLIETPVMKLIKLNYSVPQNGEGSYLTPTEIFEELTKRRKITSEFNDATPQKIGYALTNLGFQKKSGIFNSKKYNTPYYAYYVTSLYDIN